MDGQQYRHLTKRGLVFEVVKAAVAKGFSPEQIADIVPPNKWISVPGELSAEEFQAEASKLQAKLGASTTCAAIFAKTTNSSTSVGGHTRSVTSGA